MTASDFLTTQTVGGYLVCFMIAGGFIYHYSSKNKPAQVAKQAKAYVEPRKDTNAKKQRKAAFASSAPKSTTEDKGSSSAVETSNAWLTNNPKDDVDNAEFARRMASIKEGKKFDGKSSGDSKKKTKSVKQSRAAEKKPAEVAEKKEPAPASAPAVEAVEAVEDVQDGSAAASPEVTPADPSGVSDMLEPSAGGPSVLRLTGTDKEKPKAKNQKVPEKAETKKQRQNRQKVEAKKAAREEEEKERRVKLEKQRRTAREAAGILAKDGSQFMAAVNGNKSAWTAGSPNGASPNGAPLAVQPLDTFEAPAKNDAAPAQASNNWISSLPSEEEQIERLKEDDEWNTVPAKSKKAKKENRTPSPEPAKATAAPAQSRPVAQAVQKPASNGKAAKPVQSNFGSFSALSTEEEEWDV
ncbi:hypothetical protein CGRA01v4_05151 [Colletotrichum graminicola]|uniref:Uncharacterized protein n=1 Tax=Colletotrichum graminicola (strain M1.001 / M2 / FGSC 10212) TaxID=645133 RepID=E3QET5_COLGM|nr:uncharacterized protein GLRG_04535 [Colletotrichum graminicola M1.001]EFQ29391.1 hypothetical protein GLRG_04535 [Colletotrichum graminicola M1.001]WDK13870.1 hypothetical protein CGRA01v4_05151 [Colletotrichum graminicola]